MAHACGVTVEDENAAKHPGEVSYTSAEEAKAYVDRTGVDCLAVSISTARPRQA